MQRSISDRDPARGGHAASWGIVGRMEVHAGRGHPFDRDCLLTQQSQSAVADSDASHLVDPVNSSVVNLTSEINEHSSSMFLHGRVRAESCRWLFRERTVARSRAHCSLHCRSRCRCNERMKISRCPRHVKAPVYIHLMMRLQF